MLKKKLTPPALQDTASNANQSSDRSGITRRSLIRGAAGVSSGLLIGGGPSGCSKRPPLEKKTADVVIVGAGLSGLVAARELLKAGVQSVMVLEARDRVGGLTVSQEAAPGVFVDGGGSWVGPAHTQILALAKEFGVPIADSAEAPGKPIIAFDGVRFAGTGRLLTHAETRERAQLQEKLEAMAASLPLGAPWNAPGAAEYDKLTMFNWLADNSVTKLGKRRIEQAIDWTFGCHPEDISLLRFLAAINAQGGLAELGALSDAQEISFVGGAQQVSLRMAEALGDRVLLSSPVTRIVDDPAGRIRVETGRLSIECNRVVVAMMPADAKRIDFEPRLPEQKRGLISNWRGSPDYKAHIVYEKPFWRESGFNGTAIGDGTVVDFIFDGTPPSGTPGVLVAFGAGEELPSTLDARKEAVVNALVDYFDEDARNAIHFVELDWHSEAWSSGCASPLAPGVLSVYGSALREVTGRIHWAGSDTAIEFDGFMEGAVRSGERVATEVAAVLRESGVIPAPAKSG